MAKRVLSVGQCAADHAAIKAFLKREFAAEVQAAHTADETMSMLSTGPFDLVLVNRIFDADSGSGLDLIKAIKSTPTTGKIPAMLVSNYADAQEKAVGNGAEPGFGKAALGDKEVVERLAPFLGESED